MIEIAIPIVLYISVIANAFHDKWITPRTSWWMWHVCKWIMVFSVWGMLVLVWWCKRGCRWHDIHLILLFAGFCGVSWRVVYKH
jgi:hypothetical protein